MATPRAYANVLLMTCFCWLGLAWVDSRIMHWHFFDSQAMIPWLAACFAASYICRALHLVWEKL